uniref:Uncharacterized protein n=1 Tax=Vespula pensylvanica TaxID=30213 RepID=A0A834PGG1_VESPE|nr:hypothetical protein H0235_001122 [Vespula pensylvanica]
MEDEDGLLEYYRQKRNWKITDNASGVENYFLGRRLEWQLYACRLLSSYDPKYEASSLSDSSIPREVLRFKPNT